MDEAARQREQERSRRKRAVRAKSEPVHRMSQAQRQVMVLLTDYPKDVQRPRTRGECVDGPRPCPFVSCQWHLYLDVSTRTGSIKLNFPDLEVWELPESCALDVADRGGATLEGVGALLNVTRERCRQLEVKALAQLEALHDAALRELADPGPVRRRRLPVLEAEDEAQWSTSDASWEAAD